MGVNAQTLQFSLCIAIFCVMGMQMIGKCAIPAHRFSVAPMMEWTDRHCRFFHRLLTRRALIYTEMITTGAVLRGDRARLLAYDAAEHPVALQLGGSDPQALAAMRPHCRKISATTRSTSMSAVRRTACRRAASAPV